MIKSRIFSTLSLGVALLLPSTFAFYHSGGSYLYKTTSNTWTYTAPIWTNANNAITGSGMSDASKTKMTDMLSTLRGEAFMASGQPNLLPSNIKVAEDGDYRIEISSDYEAEGLSPRPAGYQGPTYIVTVIMYGPDAPTNVAPAASITAPSGTVYAGSSTSWPISATDGDANLSGYRVYLDGGSAPGWTAISGSAFNSTFTFNATTAGTYTFRIDVQDSEGLTATSTATKTVEIDTSLRTLTVNRSPSNLGSATGAGTYTNGTTATVNVTVPDGYSLTWSGNATGSDNPLSVLMNSDKVVTANFTAITPSTHTLTVATSPSYIGTVSGGGTYNDGETASATAPAAPDGWEFAGWSGAASGTSNPVSVTMDADKSLTAVYTAVTPDPVVYTLSVSTSPSDVGSVSGSGQYNDGETASVSATVPAGYALTWSGDATGSDNPLSVLMTSDKSVTAVFTPLSVPTASISASPDTGVVAFSSTLSWTTSGADSVTLSGPSFSSTDASGSQALNFSSAGSYVYTLTATNSAGSTQDEVTIEAQPSTYVLSTSVNGDGAVTAGGTYPRPNPSVTGVTITATPTGATMFSSWGGDTAGTVNTPQSDGSASLYVPMTQDRSITASFVGKVSQTITFPNPGARSMKDGPFSLSASASSGLPVTFAVTSGPATVDGSVVTLSNEGTVVITAYQPGDSTYLAATPVSVSFESTNPVKVRLIEDKANSSISNGEAEETNFGTHE